MNNTVKDIVRLLTSHRLELQSEKILQREIHDMLVRSTELFVSSEYRLDEKNIIDFYCDASIGIEVKIKGGRREIFRQCERYCQFDDIKALILVTNRAMGLPAAINNKPCTVVNLGIAWL